MFWCWWLDFGVRVLERYHRRAALHMCGSTVGELMYEGTAYGRIFCSAVTSYRFEVFSKARVGCTTKMYVLARVTTLFIMQHKSQFSWVCLVLESLGLQPVRGAANSRVARVLSCMGLIITCC